MKKTIAFLIVIGLIILCMKKCGCWSCFFGIEGKKENDKK